MPFSKATARPTLARRALLPFAAVILVAGGVLLLSADLRERVMGALGASAGPTAAAPAASSGADPGAGSAPAPAGTTTAGQAPGAPSASAPAAAGSAPAAAAPSTVDGLDGPTWRRVLQQSATAQDALRGAKAIVALAQVDPGAFQRPELIPAAAAVAVAVEIGDRRIADSVFDVLSSERLGGGGPDVLFHMTSFYGGSRGAKRAADLLLRPEILGRATPALQVAMALRDASCAEKPGLFDRAAREGDERTLSQLAKMRDPDCQPSTGICCMMFDQKLKATIAQIRVRLQRGG
jgi:serine/threonine-protein kinase